MKRLLIAVALVAACGDGPLGTRGDGATDAQPVAVAPVDAGGDSQPCAEWGCAIGCNDGGCGCWRYVCVSYEPSDGAPVDSGHLFTTQQAAAAACPFGWVPSPTDSTLAWWTCQCEQSCGPCPAGWHKAGPWLATCEQDGIDGGVD